MPDHRPSQVISALVDVRRARGMSQDDVAALRGVSQAAQSEWERGLDARLSTVFAVADVLGCTISMNVSPGLDAPTRGVETFTAMITAPPEEQVDALLAMLPPFAVSDIKDVRDVLLLAVQAEPFLRHGDPDADYFIETYGPHGLAYVHLVSVVRTAEEMCRAQWLWSPLHNILPDIDFDGTFVEWQIALSAARLEEMADYTNIPFETPLPDTGLIEKVRGRVIEQPARYAAFAKRIALAATRERFLESAWAPR